MSGIYIHIPFCLSRCSYCDFYSTIDTDKIHPFSMALIHELEQRNNELDNTIFDTIYMGGGTPSVLSVKTMRAITATIEQNYELTKNKEFTVEVNPEDVGPTYLDQMIKIGVNRISMGVQSMQDHHLKLMKRRHNAGKAKEIIKCLTAFQSSGSIDVNADLIYGIPGMTRDEWEYSIDEFIKAGFNHISAYHLTFEKGTALTRKLMRGEITETDESESLWQFMRLSEKLGEAGYEHYEISNFAKDNYYARHNTKYWNGNSYLGFGPSAHSFNGMQRSWNKKSLKLYIECYFHGTRSVKDLVKQETINSNSKWNEMIMTRLRTMWGISKKDICNEWDEEKWQVLKEKIKPYIKSGDASLTKGCIKLSKRGWFRSDGIFAALFDEA